MTTTPKIPIQNIYYLLCYAWNKLDEKDVVDVTGIDTTSILDLFSKVLISGLNHLLKRGLDRGYVSYSEDVRCLKGKIHLSPTIKRNLLLKVQAHCEYDELSHNVLHNQILKATIRLLIYEDTIEKDFKDQLIGLYRKLHEVADIQLTYPVFSRVQLHRNNSFYDFLIKICELIYDNMLISEDSGKSKFRDFLQDERKMAYLFEEFVRNFYRIETPNYKVSREDIFWYATPLDEHSGKYLPKMVTDISIEKNGSKVIIDTKYYKEALAKYYDQEKIHSSHLFQIFGYLKNLEAKGGINISCSGVLLYPTVDRDIELNYMVDEHKVIPEFCTKLAINAKPFWFFLDR
jgi:5-methylcytosine-specific restriction enzyme subunit McrC